VERLLDRLIGDLGRKPEQRADPARRAWPEMRDMVDLVLVQADALHQVDLDFVAGGEPPNQRRAVLLHRLRDCQHRRDVVARVAVFGGEERIVEVELAHRDAVGPGCPFGADEGVVREAEDVRAVVGAVSERLRAGRADRAPRERGGGDSGVVDHAVADHLGDFGFDRNRIGGDGGEFPGELVLPRQFFGGFVSADVVKFHGRFSVERPREGGARRCKARP